MPGDSAYRTAAACTGAAEINLVVIQSRTPQLTNLFRRFGKGKGQCVLKDIAMIKSERFLNVDRAFAFDAGKPSLALARQSSSGSSSQLLSPRI